MYTIDHTGGNFDQPTNLSNQLIQTLQPLNLKNTIDSSKSNEAFKRRRDHSKGPIKPVISQKQRELI
jgi:hypothetical protein